MPEKNVKNGSCEPCKKLSKWRGIGSIIFRRSFFAHRLIRTNKPCWSLFIFGPKVRKWGFHGDNEWIYWKDFLRNKGEIINE